MKRIRKDANAGQIEAAELILAQPERHCELQRQWARMFLERMRREASISTERSKAFPHSQKGGPREE
jgi:hypothetical protein